MKTETEIQDMMKKIENKMKDTKDEKRIRVLSNRYLMLEWVLNKDEDNY